MRIDRIGGVFCLVLMLVMPSDSQGAEQATYFRHNYGIVFTETPLPHEFNMETELVWRVPIASGISSPCVHGDNLILTTFEKDTSELATVVIDSATGRVLWTRPAPATRLEAVHPTGSPAASTAACDGERIYSFFGSYGLLCYDLKGNLLWSRPMGPFQDEFGASSSPLLTEELVILNQDHDVDSQLIALDKRTGQDRWATPRPGFTRSYSSPILLKTAEQESIVVAGALRMVAYDASSGQSQWWVNGLSRIIDSTPVIADGKVFIASWTPGGDSSSRISMEDWSAALQSYDADRDGLIAKSELPSGPVLQRFFRIDLNQDQLLSRDEWEAHANVFELAKNVAMSIEPGGTGDVTQTAIQWTSRRGLPTVPSSIVYNGIMYMVKDSGIVTSLDAATGDMLKQGRARGRGNYYASIMAGDGKVYLASERGVVTVLKAGRDWSILESYDFGERILATPAIDNGCIYLRTDDAVYCFRK